MNNVEKAVSRFKEGHVCSQAILSTYGVQFGIDEEIALRIACPFGGGMARMGETCGAVSGAFMVFGIKYGRVSVEDKQAKDKTYSLVNKFVEKFKARNSTIVCRELLGCDINTPQAVEKATEEGLFDTVCPKLVQDAAELLEELL